jgi:two-component system C4-dicarboxylate transport response regulator DctD
MVGRRIVLLVDDDVPETAMRSVLYQSERFIALTAFRWDEALIICEQLPIGLAVLDVEMPGCNGLELARKIRALDRSICIVMYSGAYGVEWQGVADAFLEKTSGARQLLEISRKLMSTKRMRLGNREPKYHGTPK